nr:hypothetical protein CFP56_54680 [Quercus suber]
MRNIGGLNLNPEGSSVKSTPSVPKRGRQCFIGNKGCDQATSTPTNPLGDYLNRSQTMTPSKLNRKWTKLARAPSIGKHSGPLLMDTNHRPSIDQEKEQGGVDCVISKVGALLQEFQTMQASPATAPTIAALHQWRPPEYPFFKANFDAAVFKTSSSVDIGVIIRDGMEKQLEL